MELAIPLVALSGLYLISKDRGEIEEDKEEGFMTNNTMEDLLPNTNIPNVNYLQEYPVKNVDLDVTTKLANDNKYTGISYTDKYYTPPDPKDILNNDKWASKTGMKCPPRELSGGSEDFIALTGDKVGCEYYTHNNMVPFFGSKTRSRKFEANQNEGLMDTYLGTGSQTIDKREQAPLFAPNENHQWSHGAPNQNDFMQSRVNPSLKMANVVPFKQEKVAPGIGQGYTSEGVGGYNSGMMDRESWMPKTVDELRVNNHRKASGVSTIGYEGPASSIIKQRGSLGKMEKNGPVKEFATGPERYMTTTGLEKGPTLRPIQEDRYTNRPETTQDYSGIAAGESSTYIDGKYRPSTNHHLGPVPISAAGASGKGGASENDYGAKSQQAYNNNRTSNTQDSYFGMIGGAIGSVVSPLLDVVRPSRKENTIGTLRPYQNASTAVPLSYVFNPADRPNTTTRETTENSKFHMNSGTSEFNKGGYTVTSNQPVQNARMTQSDYFYAGNSSANDGSKGLRPYDSEYNQRNNDIKSSTIDGRLVKGNMALLNNQNNIRCADRVDKLSQNYMTGPSNHRSPGLETMGQLQGKQELYAGLNNDRLNNLDVKQVLTGNPYALSINTSNI
jgi:hypothetical protein